MWVYDDAFAYQSDPWPLARRGDHRLAGRLARDLEIVPVAGGDAAELAGVQALDVVGRAVPPLLAVGPGLHGDEHALGGTAELAAGRGRHHEHDTASL